MSDTIKLKFDLSRESGEFKILNAVNGGPWHKRHANDQYRSNFEDYKNARIPYSRNHDSAEIMVYGGPYSHDITSIFRDFDADENDPASYDFACTDESILCTLEAGTKTFFRLGQTIEHQIKKHGTLPPKDFHKWARICEHIIRHYNEGWADGYRLDMKYWEIWNEPDLDTDDSTNKRCWGGTRRQFFDFYEIAAKHLKSCFPNLMIGGPAIAGSESFAEEFLAEMKRREVPIDFFSWHIYCTTPEKMIARADKMKAILEKTGYGNVESILNEWNYIKGWKEEFKYSVLAIHGIKGAAFTMACISKAQESANIDMLMYYDARPTMFCGAFDYYTCEKLKGYYPIMWYGGFYDLKAYVSCLTSEEGLYTLCGKGDDGKISCIVTYYTNDDDAEDKKISLDFGRDAKFEAFLLDETSDGESIGVTDSKEFVMKRHSCIMLKEI